MLISTGMLRTLGNPVRVRGGGGTDAKGTVKLCVVHEHGREPGPPRGPRLRGHGPGRRAGDRIGSALSCAEIGETRAMHCAKPLSLSLSLSRRQIGRASCRE